MRQSRELLSPRNTFAGPPNREEALIKDSAQEQFMALVYESHTT